MVTVHSNLLCLYSSVSEGKEIRRCYTGERRKGETIVCEGLFLFTGNYIPNSSIKCC